jgi:hypothetical protein
MFRYLEHKDYNMYLLQALRLEYRLAYISGDYNGALSFFLQQVKYSKNKYSFVKNHYILASIYEKQGDEYNQNEHLKFVAENGGNLWIAKEAKRILSGYISIDK